MTHEYVIDKKGNWIKKYSYDKEGILTRLETREIVYSLD
jgi:hypothetical protein